MDEQVDKTIFFAQKNNQPQKSEDHFFRAKNKPAKKISIIIPTYNHCDDLLKPCIESIRQFTDFENTEVIIVANGCTDNTREYVNSLPEPFKFIWVDAPLGYPKAINEGIKQSNSEYIILLNNDTVLLQQNKNDWIDILLKPFQEDEKMGITGPLKSYSVYQKPFLIFFLVMVNYPEPFCLQNEFGASRKEC